MERATLPPPLLAPFSLYWGSSSPSTCATLSTLRGSDPTPEMRIEQGLALPQFYVIVRRMKRDANLTLMYSVFVCFINVKCLLLALEFKIIEGRNVRRNTGLEEACCRGKARAGMQTCMGKKCKHEPLSQECVCSHLRLLRKLHHSLD